MDIQTRSTLRRLLAETTPGDWHADIRAACAAIYPVSQEPNGNEWANGLHPTDHGRTIIVWHDGGPDTTQEANLHLIAAAHNSLLDLLDTADERDNLARTVNALVDKMHRLMDRLRAVAPKFDVESANLLESSETTLVLNVPSEAARWRRERGQDAEA